MRLGVAGEEEEEEVELRRADMEMEGRNVDLVWAGEREGEEGGGRDDN